jgi:membrane fusion protein, multidrug efflux system
LGEVASIQYATGARFSLLPPDNASGNFTKVVQRVPVRITLNPEEANAPPGASARPALRPGMSVSVAIDVRQGG